MEILFVAFVQYNKHMVRFMVLLCLNEDIWACRQTLRRNPVCKRGRGHVRGSQPNEGKERRGYMH